MIYNIFYVNIYKCKCLLYMCVLYIFIYIWSTCTCKQKQKNKYYGSCHMAVNDLINTAKNKIFKHVIIGYGYTVFGSSHVCLTDIMNTLLLAT